MEDRLRVLESGHLPLKVSLVRDRADLSGAMGDVIRRAQRGARWLNHEDAEGGLER